MLEAALRGSDVVCLCTHAYEPVIQAGWVRPGTHVPSVGYAPPRGELPAKPGAFDEVLASAAICMPPAASPTNMASST